MCVTPESTVTTLGVTSLDPNVLSINVVIDGDHNSTYILKLCSLPVNLSVEVNGVKTDVVYDGDSDGNQHLVLDCGGMFVFFFYNDLVTV